ncbi:MAG: HDOD domain-containing protein [Candidatus Kapaibacterium sp.]
MLERPVTRKLESLSELPAIPHVISRVLDILDNPDTSAGQIARLIEQDQTLTARVLRVANSPFYGFSRRISTIDLAVVVMGTNAIKEIVMSLIIQRFFANIGRGTFDVRDFWKYSVFCGAAARLLARKMGYRLAGEAFVAGLMHDIGYLIMIEYFSNKFKKIRELQNSQSLSLCQAETEILGGTHAEIGAWLSEKWNLPAHLGNAIRFHHTPYRELNEIEAAEGPVLMPESAEQTLAVIVAMTEWFAREMGYMNWTQEQTFSPLYLANETLESISDSNIYEADSAIEALKFEIDEEYQKAGVLSELPEKPLF